MKIEMKFPCLKWISVFGFFLHNILIAGKNEARALWLWVM